MYMSGTTPTSAGAQPPHSAQRQHYHHPPPTSATAHGDGHQHGHRSTRRHRQHHRHDGGTQDRHRAEGRRQENDRCNSRPADSGSRSGQLHQHNMNEAQRKQLGRRNLTDEQKTYMVGKMYEARKNSHGGDRKSSAQNGPLKEAGRRVSEQVALEIGIGKETVKRAEKFSKGVDAVKAESPEAAAAHPDAQKISRENTEKPHPRFPFQKSFSGQTALSAHSAVQSFMEATVRAYVLCSDRDQLLSVFRAGTPAFTDPAKALEAAKVSGRLYIIL